MPGTKDTQPREQRRKNKISELNIVFHDDRCGVADGTSICIINCDQASARLRLPLCRSTGSRGVREPGSGGVSGRANCWCIVACGAPQRPSGALASDAAEVGDELLEYLGSWERGNPRSTCCGYVGLDALSSPVDVENWECACDVSDGVDGP